MTYIILAVLMAMPPSKFDDETSTARLDRATETARVVASVSSSLNDAAVLLTIAHHESRFAQYVREGCIPDLIPDGAAPCDWGLARSYWQMQRAACRPGWALPRGSDEAQRAFARCALRQYKAALRRCRTRQNLGYIAGGFSGYGGIRCELPSSRARAETYRDMRRRLWAQKSKIKLDARE